jgi:hypothetical protein
MTKSTLRLIDKAESHFKEVLAGGLMGPIKVDEWDAEIWYKPSTTLHEEAKVIELTQQGKATEALVVTLINRARDKDGNLLFDMGDQLKLMRNVDPKVVLSVVTQFNSAKESVDDIVGN